MTDYWHVVVSVPFITSAAVSRHASPLVRQGNLWFFPDFSMYVYYVPRVWRPLSDGMGVDAR